MHRRLPSLIVAVKGYIEQFWRIQKVAHAKSAIFVFISKIYNVLGQSKPDNSEIYYGTQRGTFQRE